MELFPHWYIGEYRQFSLDAAQRLVLDKAFAAIADSALAWPSVYMHRDFMPRNLMVSADAMPSFNPGKPSATRLGVLDFQDAVYGPITYDIASLLRDAFLSWEEDFCLDITIRYWDKARKAGLPVGDDFGEFYKGVEWMGLQRHLKIAGIFARLSIRDGKPDYLADTPRFIAYIRTTCARYMELKPLLRLVERIEGIPMPNAYAFGRTQ
jgi:aminoglycoside/choline kinase family phosphotransferase